MYITIKDLYKTMTVVGAGIYFLWSLESCSSTDSKGKSLPVAMNNSPVMMPKDTLLLCLGEVVEATASSKCDLEKVRQIFSKRSKRFKMEIFPVGDAQSKDNETILIAKNDVGPGKCDVSVYLPKDLQSSLTFLDLKEKFGNWEGREQNGIPIPQPKIPFTKFVLGQGSSNVVNLNVQSLDLPEAKNNAIFDINVF